MKKVVSAILCIALLAGLVTALFGCNKTPREEVLKLYMPGEYIDEDIFEEFESWYQENYGKKVTVQLETFDAVEDIQLAVEGSKADYDLLCPSDYMVEYLISKNLLLESNVNLTKDGLFRDEYVETTRQFDPTLKYAVPYMYGTLGLVYDKTKTNKTIDSWEALFGSEFSGKRSVKDSVRDAYAAACGCAGDATIKFVDPYGHAMAADFVVTGCEHSHDDTRTRVSWDLEQVGEAEQEVYDQLRQDMVVTLGDKEIDAVNAAALTGKLLQMANGAVYTESGAPVPGSSAPV